MADTTPYDYPDAPIQDQLRYLKQQYAAAVKAQRLRSADGREIWRQPLEQLTKEIERLELLINRRTGVVLTSHGRR